MILTGLELEPPLITSLLMVQIKIIIIFGKILLMEKTKMLMDLGIGYTSDIPWKNKKHLLM